MLKRALFAILFVCGVAGGAQAQSLNDGGAPFTGTAIGSGHTFTGAGTQLYALSVSAYQNLQLPFSTSLWVKYPTLSTGLPYATFLNATNNPTYTTGFVVWAPYADSADSLLLQSFIEPNIGSCVSTGRLCANIGLIHDNALHHLCTSWTAYGSAFYVDGILRTISPSGAKFTVDAVDPWVLGLNVPSGTSEVDVAAWNRPLSASECVAIYNRGIAGFSLLSGNAPASLNDGLIAYWSLSDCTGVVCPDSSPTNNPMSTDPAPTVAVTLPVDDPGGLSPVSGTITVSATCTDTRGITSVVLSIDGILLANFTTGPFSTSFDTTLLTDANNPHTATAACTNLAGVTSTAANTFYTNNGVIPPKTFYMAVNGNDSHPGTSGSPWLTPNHPLRCGDTILATPSQSWSNMLSFGTVWSCPTTVDPGSSVQFAFLKCAITTGLQDCYLNNTSAFNSISVNNDHWAIQGWAVNAPQGHCFQIAAVPGRPIYPGSTAGSISAAGSQLPRYVLWVNTYANNCGASGYTIADYNATVGSIVYGAAYNFTGTAYSGMSGNAMFNNNPSDTGTHIYNGGNFVINNGNSPGGTDGEGIILDDWFEGASAAHPIANTGYDGQTVIEQNLFFGGSSFGLELNATVGTTTPFAYSQHFVTQSTFWGNGLMGGPAYTDPTHSHGQGGSQIGGSNQTLGGPGGLTITNSILVTNGATYCFTRTAPFTCPPGNIGTMYVISWNGCYGQPCIADNTNYLYNSAVPANIITGAGGFTDHSTHANPGFASPAFITSAPNCATSPTAVQCLATSIANFKPSGGAAALGYQRPATCSSGPTCQGGFVCVASDPLYPVWLKGAVPDGLVTKPCGY